VQIFLHKRRFWNIFSIKPGIKNLQDNNDIIVASTFFIDIVSSEFNKEKQKKEHIRKNSVDSLISPRDLLKFNKNKSSNTIFSKKL
jgi:hypothetical protein